METMKAFTKFDRNGYAFYF